MTTTIDSFISLPLLVSAGVAALVLLFMLLIRLRKKARISYIFYVVAAIIIVGSLYCYYTEYYIYYVFTVTLSLAITLPYLIIKAFDNPQKREEKKAAKKSAELAAAKDADMVSKKALAEIEEKHQRILDVNKDLIAKVSSFFSSDNSMENYLEYCNDLIAQRVSADGCIILMADDYDNTLAVKSFKGSFPPPYKLPDDLPHKPIRVETNLRFAQFQLEGNIFGEIFSSG